MNPPREEDRARLRGMAAVALLGLLHLFLQPVLAGWWGSPHLAAAAVLVAGVRLRPGAAAIAGFSLGLLEEALLLAGPGPLAAVYAAAGYVAARSWTLFFTDTRVILPVYIASGGWILIVLNTVVTSFGLTWSFIFLKAPVAAALTGLAAAPALWTARSSG